MSGIFNLRQSTVAVGCPVYPATCTFSSRSKLYKFDGHKLNIIFQILKNVPFTNNH